MASPTESSREDCSLEPLLHGSFVLLSGSFSVNIAPHSPDPALPDSPNTFRPSDFFTILRSQKRTPRYSETLAIFLNYSRMSADLSQDVSGDVMSTAQWMANPFVCDQHSALPSTWSPHKPGVGSASGSSVP